MKQLSKEQIKELRSALSFWRDDYDRDDDAEQYNMFDNVMAAMDMLLAGMTQDPVGSHHFDSKALELSRRVMAIMYGPMPIGGSVQLQAQVQCLFVGAMQYAASPAPVVPEPVSQPDGMPDRIWLNTAGQWPEDGREGEVTWCHYPQHELDTLYVRLSHGLRAATALDILMRAAPNMLADESLKDPGGALCGKRKSDAWIPCSDRMPEPNVYVLVSNGVWVGQGLHSNGEHLEDDERWQDEHQEFIDLLHHPVTHWQPLPALPRG